MTQETESDDRKAKSIKRDGICRRARIAGFDPEMGNRFVTAFDVEDMSIEEIARYADTDFAIIYRIIQPEF